MQNHQCLPIRHCASWSRRQSQDAPILKWPLDWREIEFTCLEESKRYLKSVAMPSVVSVMRSSLRYPSVMKTPIAPPSILWKPFIRSMLWRPSAKLR